MDKVTDDVFEQYANNQQKEAEERASKGTGSRPSTYVDIKWTGLEKNTLKLLRAVGGPPDSKVDQFTARTVRVAWIFGDDGKKFRVILPEAADAPDHLLWSIIARVKRTEWVDNKRTCPVEIKHPEIFNIVAKNGFAKGTPAFMFDRGWTGRHVLLMNVIDREMGDWHEENKHTALVSRQIGVGKDGGLFPEVGVPSYGFVSSLGNLFKYYKSWEKYDIGITKTGQKEAPYRIINASKYLEEVPEAMQGLVNPDPLTDEERAYEQYDLLELFKFTNYTNIYNHLKGKIAKIDAVLDTNFLAEMKYQVDKEKEEYNQKKAEETHADLAATAKNDLKVVEEGPAVVVEESVESTPTRVRTAVAENDLSKLKGWSVLTKEEQDGIESVDTTVTPAKVVYKDKDAVLLACPNCMTPGPESYAACAVCGLQF